VSGCPDLALCGHRSGAILNEFASVVMAVCNGREFLAAQLDSVISQLQPEDELIIVDDASTDGSAHLCRSAASQNIRLFTNPQNLGVIASFQRGLSLARHEVVFLCDQDDLWLPGKRAAFMSEFARDSGISVVISDVEVIDRHGNLLAPSFMATRGGFNGTVMGTLWRNRYLGCAMAVRRSLLRVALPFPKGVPMHDMWLGVVGRVMGRVVYLRTPQLRYRRHGNNATPMRSRAPWHRLLRWRVGLLLMLVRRLVSVRLGLHKFAFLTGIDH
jgi:glycosyltransferase involved in cell wall biosynthesis